MTALTVGATAQAHPSMVDRFLATVDRLPGPPEAAFLLGGGLVALVTHAIVWANGAYSIGVLVPDLWIAPVVAGYFLALSAFMTRTADSAFDDFRAALGDPEKEAAERQRFTSVSDRAALLGGLALVLVTFFVYLFVIRPVAAPRPAVVEALTGILWLPASFVLGVVVAQTIAQLGTVRHLSHIAQRIDILNPGPVDALSRVTVVGGAGLLIFVAVASVAEPATTTTAYLGLDVAVIGFAALSFFLPLGVMHGRLGAQKAELIAASSKRVRTVLEQLHAAIDAADLSVADGLNKMVSSALAEREMLSRLSTWPWTSTTIRGFGSALLLPVIIFVITRGIDRLF